jgi:very-short-patch-repair endonuclease
VPKTRAIDGIALTRSRRLRSAQTDAEKKLWSAIRGGRFESLKFRRQFVIGQYIVDFCCIEKKLIVELDGGQHDERAAQDVLRTSVLEREGFGVIRFWNDEVLKDLEGVLERMRRVIGDR